MTTQTTTGVTAEVALAGPGSIARYGGDLGVRDRGLIESAVAVPQQSLGGEYLHKTIFEMAAAYALHIAESQGFVDGNKRAGLASATAFLAMNGHDLAIAPARTA